MTVHVTWPHIERHAKKRIEDLRSALEAAPPERIALLQAEVRVWRQVLALPTDLAPIEQSSSAVGEY